MVGQARDFILGMADVEYRDLQLVMQAFEVGQDLVFALAVECGKGFVHQQQLRTGEQRAGDADALAFAAREMLRVAFQQVADAQQFAGLGQVYPSLGAGNTPQAERQVSLHREVREQAGFLEHVAEGTLVRWDKLLAVAVLPDFVVDLDKRLRGLFQAGDAAQAGGLARARVTEQRGDAASGQVQVEIQAECRVAPLQAHLYRRGHGSAPAHPGLAA